MMAQSNITLIQRDMDYLKEGMERLEITLSDHIKKEESHIEKQMEQMEKLIEKLDQKYAAKWTEKILIFLGSALLTTIFTGVMYIITKH